MEPATGPDALSVTHSRPGHRPNFPAGEARPGRERPDGPGSTPLPGVVDSLAHLLDLVVNLDAECEAAAIDGRQLDRDRHRHPLRRSGEVSHVDARADRRLIGLERRCRGVIVPVTLTDWECLSPGAVPSDAPGSAFTPGRRRR